MESVSVSGDIGGKKIEISTSISALQADGSVSVRIGDTIVLAMARISD